MSNSEIHLSDALGFLKFGWRKLFITILLILVFFPFLTNMFWLIASYVIASMIVILIDKTLAYVGPNKKIPEWYELDFRIIIVSVILSLPLILFWLALPPFPLYFWSSIVLEILKPIWIIYMIIFSYQIGIVLGGPTIIGVVMSICTIGLSIIIGIIPSALIVYFFDWIRGKKR